MRRSVFGHRDAKLETYSATGYLAQFNHISIYELLCLRCK